MGMVTLIYAKIYFKAKLTKRDGEGHCIFQKDDILILNTYTPNKMTPTFVKETLLHHKSHIDSHTLIIKDFNTQLH